jgi:Bacterial Ig domain
MQVLRRLSVVGVMATAAALLGPIGPAVGATASVTLSGVTGGATVAGPVTLTAQGTAGAGDTADVLNFVIDGRRAASEPCPNDVTSCTESYVWDATGLTGTHTVQAQLETGNDETVTGALFTITVVSPAPTVAITGPASGSQVDIGTVPVSAVGTVDPSQTDKGSQMTLLVDGTPVDSELCPLPFSRSCPVTLSWDTIESTGAHTLQAQFETVEGSTVSSAAISVVVHVSTRSTVGPVIPRPYGHTAHLTGTVASASGDPLARVPVQVTLRPASGKASTKTVTTNAEGEWSLAYKAKVNTSVVASVVASAFWGASHASTKVQVYATGKCVAKQVVDPGATDTMVCSKLVPTLAKGTKVQVQAQLFGNTKWRTLVTAKVSGAKFSVPFRLTARGEEAMRLYIPATKALAASETSPFFISVI